MDIVPLQFKKYAVALKLENSRSQKMIVNRNREGISLGRLEEIDSHVHKDYLSWLQTIDLKERMAKVFGEESII